MDLHYNEIFTITNMAMRINRCHPDIKKDKKWINYFLLTYGLFFLGFLVLLYNFVHNIKDRDFANTCKNGVLVIVFVVVSYQYMLVVWNQTSIKYLMEAMKEDYHLARSLSVDERKIVAQYAKKCVYICRQWLLISCAACGTFPIKNFYLLAYYWAKGTPKFVPIMDLIYPSVIEEYKESAFVYPVIYCILLYYGIYSMGVYTAFVPLGPSCMLHACAQLELAEWKLIDLFRNDASEVNEKLKQVVRQIQKIYRFVEHIQKTFQIAYELTLRCSTIMMPITLFELLESIKRGEVPVELVTFLIGSVLISTTPCFYSERLVEKSESFRLAVYSCGWQTVFDRSSRATILLLLTRAHKPIAIRTLFRTLNLEFVADLARQSYTIFNLMNAMWK